MKRTLKFRKLKIIRWNNIAYGYLFLKEKFLNI